MKFNAYLGLTSAAKMITEAINEDLVAQYILEISDHKKHCGGKRTEMESYAIGKLLIVKAFSKQMKNQGEVVASIIGLLPDFPAMDEQIL